MIGWWVLSEVINKIMLLARYYLVIVMRSNKASSHVFDVGVAIGSVVIIFSIFFLVFPLAG